MFEAPSDNEVLALALAMQALDLVRDVAQDGYADPEAVEPCLAALLGQYEGDIGALCGGRGRILPGLKGFISHLQQPDDPELSRYLIALVLIERRLSRDRERMSQLATGLDRARAQADYFHQRHENVIRNLADLYRETVSPIKPQIMVRGERGHLEDERNAALVRALLLSALRAVSLWRASGGGRLRLLLQRKALVVHAQRLLP